MSESPRLRLPYLAPSQAQKHVTHNEALRMLDAFVQLVVQNRVQTVPPAMPEEGAAYLLAAPSAGEFAGQEGKLAMYQDGAWSFCVPGEGWRVWIREEAALLVLHESEWVPVSHPGEVRHSHVGVNADADPANRLSVKSDSVLFSHDDVTPGSGDFRVALNKAALEKTAALVFQTDYDGRAELGLSGDDIFRLKLSTDGDVWTSALVADPATRRLSIGTEATEAPLTVASEEGSYPLSLKIEETTHPVSARAAILIGNWGVGQDALGSGDRDFFFYDGNTSALRGTIGISGGLVWGGPAGGDMGVGTINAEAVYDDNALLSCYVFDQVLDGAIDGAKWDRRVPVPPPQPGSTQADAARSSETGPRRLHAPMRRFRSRIGTAHDPLTLDGYAAHWKEKRHLSALPNEADFDAERGLPTGAWIQRLVETVEVQAVLIEELNQRLKRVE